MNKFVKNVALYVLLIIIAVSIFNTFVHPQEKHSEITYSDFISQVEKKNVDSVTMTNNSISGKLKDGSEFATYAPDNDAQLLPKLSEGGVIKTAGTAVLVDESAFLAASDHHSGRRVVLDHEPDTGRRRTCHELWQVQSKDDSRRPGPCEFL